MSTTVKAANEAVPFFARFLEEQSSAQADNAPLNTFKYPSDLEDF